MSLLSGLTNWWQLGDFLGDGSTMADAVGGRHGRWRLSPGISGAQSLDIPLFACEDDHSYEQTPTATGPAGGVVDYPGGGAFYDGNSMSFAIWGKASAPEFDMGCSCPLLVGGWESEFVFSNSDWRGQDPRIGQAGVNYARCDVVRDGTDFWQATAANFSTAFPVYNGPGTGPWCFLGSNLFELYPRAGLAGDRVGFPTNEGWAIETVDSGQMRFIQGTAIGLQDYSTELDMGAIDGDWHLYVVTSNGSHVRVYRDCVLTDELLGSGVGLSNGGLQFGFSDDSRALSNAANPWYGLIDEALLWNRELTGTEVCSLPGLWCRPSWSLSAAFRSEPSANANANPANLLQHLSGVRFRSEPGSAAPGPSSLGTDKAHLSGTRFRALG